MFCKVTPPNSNNAVIMIMIMIMIMIIIIIILIIILILPEQIFSSFPAMALEYAKQQSESYQ